MSTNSDPLTLALERAKTQIMSNFNGITVGCSGGPDSMALLHGIVEVFVKKYKKKLLVAHFNFGLRGKESDLDEVLVRDFCLGKSIDFIALRPKTTAPSRGVQAWARKERKSQLVDIAENYAIATAHHQDDLAENVLLRMSRGAAPHHLLGMQEFEGPWWKPFLGIEKVQLNAYIVRHNIPHNIDGSNATLKYNRNRIRHEVLPVLGGVSSGASRKIVENALQTKEWVEWVAPRLPQPVMKVFAGHRVWALSMVELNELPSALAKHCISELIQKNSFKQLASTLLDNILRHGKSQLSHPNRRSQIDIPGANSLVFWKKKIYLVDSVLFENRISNALTFQSD